MKLIFRLFRFYYRLVGRKLPLLLLLMFVAVAFQGLSVGLFLPILHSGGADDKISGFVRGAFGSFGVEYTLLNLLLFLVIFFLLRSIFLIAQAALVGRITSGLLVDLRCRITERIFNLDYKAFLKRSSGYFINALITEFQKVVFSFKMFSNLMVSAFFAVMYLGLSLALNPLLVLILTAGGIPIFYIIRKINEMTRRYSVNTSRHSAGLQKILIQSLSYFKYLKATSTHPRVLRQVFNRSGILGELQFKTGVLGAITQYGFEPFVVLIIAAVVFYYVGMRGENVVEQFFLLYLIYSVMSKILGMQAHFRKLLNSWGSIEVLEKLESELEKQGEVVRGKEALRKIAFDRTIRLENVGFRFEDGPQILKDINIEIHPNTTVAFVGESGAGKTTLINLLVGLFRPTEGSIFIDDIPYRDITPSLIRKNIGYVTQEYVIFNDSILNNITLWQEYDRGNKREKAESAAKKAHIAGFIRDLRGGLDSVLGEGGIDISGGQRQRICIARELFKENQIIIFDEATSSLDTKTEKEIQKNIDELKRQKTIILVAHRISTVRNSDRIFVLKDGTIVEEGTYEELYESNGEFKRMVDRQAPDGNNPKPAGY